MAVFDEELSRQYHSLRFYYGVYDSQNVDYRIGNNTSVVADETERYYDTWIDFRLIPTERPTVSVPKPNTKLVNIPGRSTPINMTTYLTGHQTFASRTGSWSFMCDNDFVESKGGFIGYQNFVHEKLHGRIRKVVLADDPGYFYFGEFSISAMNPGESRSTISISYNLYPYKKSMTCSMDMWKFDDFNFSDGVIQYMKDMSVNGTRIVNVFGSTERISPHISGSNNLSIDKYENDDWVSYGDVPTASISSPASIIPRLVIDDKIDKLRFTGNGTVTIDYRRGLL